MKLSSAHTDALLELINIGVGRSASSLYKLIKQRILLEVPVLEILSGKELRQKIRNNNIENISIVDMSFKGELSGITELIFPTDGAYKLIHLISGDLDPAQSMDVVKSNILNEIGNIILNSLIGTISNILKTRLKYNLPNYTESTNDKAVTDIENIQGSIVFAETKFKVTDIKLHGSFLLILEVGSFEKLVEILDNYINQNAS